MVRLPNPHTVILEFAKANIRDPGAMKPEPRPLWIPAFAGMTTRWVPAWSLANLLGQTLENDQLARHMAYALAAVFGNDDGLGDCRAEIVQPDAGLEVEAHAGL